MIDFNMIRCFILLHRRGKRTREKLTVLMCFEARISRSKNCEPLGRRASKHKSEPVSTYSHSAFRVSRSKMSYNSTPTEAHGCEPSDEERPNTNQNLNQHPLILPFAGRRASKHNSEPVSTYSHSTFRVSRSKNSEPASTYTHSAFRVSRSVFSRTCANEFTEERSDPGRIASKRTIVFWTELNTRLQQCLADCHDQCR